MRRLILLMALTLSFAIAATAVALATPAITLVSFDQNEYLYTYELTLSAGDGLFALDILTNGLIAPETTDPQEVQWLYLTAPDGWYGTNSFGPPDGGRWVGSYLGQGTYQFTWKVPNSQPTQYTEADAAQVWTDGSHFTTLAVQVPTSVPEPSSLGAFALFTAAAIPQLRRRFR
jgi:hypothetical protein